MSPIEWTILIYLLMGAVFSELANLGHKVLYHSPLPWSVWIAGTIGWPIVFLIGMWKK